MKIRKALACLLLVWICAVPASAAEALIPGGQIIGMEVENGKVLVAAFDTDSPARDAGVQIGDCIQKINDISVKTAQEVESALKAGSGSVALELMRNGETLVLQVEASRLGVYLKEGISGVGTVTYYNPEDMTFGALGHGVCDKNGDLMPFYKGRVLDACVKSVKKGISGTPGQLMGVVDSGKNLGQLQKNTAQGVFGNMEKLPKMKPMPVAGSAQVHTGGAFIRCTVEGCTTGEYSVQILKIYPSQNEKGRNLLLRITDPELLEATGGIVQGMSGSPIIQDGKLIGAVTHVLVNDPTTGYGIFIENMLDAAA